MKAIFLGTGTSCGVPLIGCECAVCTSTDPRNRRRRSSLYLESHGTHLVVDTSPDFREQVLSCRVPRIDAVLFTHSHADHIFGFDDIRRFNTIQNASIPSYGLPSTIEDLKRIYHYVNRVEVAGAYRPRTEFRPITGEFDEGAFHVVPLPVDHGPTPALGYLFQSHGRSLGYVPDCIRLPPEATRRLRGVDVMILDALRHTPHSTHFTVAQSVAELKKIGAGQSFIVHMGHDLDFDRTQSYLPEGISVSYDGLTLEW